MDLTTEVDRLVEEVGRYQRRHGAGCLQVGLGRVLAARWTELAPAGSAASRPANLCPPAARSEPGRPQADRTFTREAGRAR